jgi:hypothetical protein
MTRGLMQVVEFICRGRPLRPLPFIVVVGHFLASSAAVIIRPPLEGPATTSRQLLLRLRLLFTFRVEIDRAAPSVAAHFFLFSLRPQNKRAEWDGGGGAAQENPLLRAKKRIGIDWPQPVLSPYPLRESRNGNLGAHSSVLNVCCFSLASRLSNGPKNSRPLLPFLLPSFIHRSSLCVWPFHWRRTLHRRCPIRHITRSTVVPIHSSSTFDSATWDRSAGRHLPPTR